jgi:hypothetical protein
MTLFAMVRRLCGKRDGLMAVLLLSTNHITPGPAFAKIPVATATPWQ